MMNKALKFLGLVAPAAASITSDFADQLNGKELLEATRIYQQFKDEGNSVVDLN